MFGASAEAGPTELEHLGNRRLEAIGQSVPVEPAHIVRFLADRRHGAGLRGHEVPHVEVLVDDNGIARRGMPVDLESVLAQSGADRRRSIGRPQIARAMIAAGHVTSLADAFDRWLGRGCPAFVPRIGPSPETVIETIHAARGIASLAHPGRTCIDARIPALRATGLDALEVFHSDHGPDDRSRYLALARELRLLVSGGSDFHGEPARGIEPGRASLPADEWSMLQASARRHV